MAGRQRRVINCNCN